MILLFLILSSTNAFGERDVEESMNSAEMIRHWGYPVESHDVITEDGYILSVLRIPYGRSSESNDSCRRPPILLAHGLLADSSEFVQNPPESSAGMILADAGFDVFMLNQRGTTHSQRHLHLSTSDSEFWQYSLDDMAKYDAPAAIDKALELNGASTLYWIGHSQGTIVGFFMLAGRPEYSQKVRALFQLAPVGTLHFAGTFGRLLAWTLETLRPILLAPKDIGFHYPWLVGGATRLLCGASQMSGEVCKALVRFVAGPPAKTANWSRMPLHMSNFFISTSSWTMLQIGENGYYNHAYHFNGSPEDNLRRYGTTTAPPYNYSNIASDVYLFWSKNDWLTTPGEVDWLLPRFRPGIVKGTFEVPDYNHFNYADATDVADRFCSKIVEIVRSFEGNMCFS